MQEKEYELIVFQGARPIWKTVLAAILFTMVFYQLYRLIELLFEQGYQGESAKQYGNSIKLICYCLPGGIYFSLAKTVFIDTDKDKLVSRFFVGPFFRDRISSVPELEYVAVFKNKRDLYEVNLWYKGNRHYNMYAFDSELPAFKFAEKVSKKLNLDLLDATVKGNSRWIAKLLPGENLVC